MSRMLVGLDEVLARLKDRGPLPIDAVAREFGLNPLDARILLLDAHLHGLVIRNDWGEWALSARGREAVLEGENELIAESQPVHDRRLWAARELASYRRRGSRRAVLVGACVAVCALVAAVPIGLNSLAAGRPQSTAHGKLASLVAGSKHARASAVTRFSRGVITSARLRERGVRTETDLRSRARATSRYTAPVLIFQARIGSGTARVAPSRRVEMATNRSLRAKSAAGCVETDASSSTSRHVKAHQQSSSTGCVSSGHGSRPSDSSSGR
jgi:hypothetical protein